MRMILICLVKSLEKRIRKGVKSVRSDTINLVKPGFFCMLPLGVSVTFVLEFSE